MRFWSMVGQASIQTARASGPSTMERSSGLLPPLGMMAAGNANSLAVPNCMKRNAATIRRTLSRYGAHVGHFAGMLGAVMIRVSLSVLGVEGDPTPGGQPRASQDQHQSGERRGPEMLIEHHDAEQHGDQRVDVRNHARPARSGLCDEPKKYDEPQRRADHAEHRDGPQCGRRDRVGRAYKHGGGEGDWRQRQTPRPPTAPGPNRHTAAPPE